jgi:nitrous oxidase accessory protein NosD
MIHRIGLAGAAVVGVLVFVAAPANASGNSRKLHVVAPGESIQDAVDAAHPGDTIVLKAGHYDGGILISTNKLTIRGAGPSTVLRDTGTNHCLPVAGHTGICVTDPNRQSIIKRVTIKDLTVRGFDGFGIFGVGTDRLRVSDVHAINNTEYGITEFASTRGAFIGNLVAGSTEEAGLYVGDIANAHGTVVKNNVSVGNALGLLVRHAHNVTVTGNRFVANCAGIALVDDGQAGGQGDTRVMHNVIDGNNRFCPASEDAPPLKGTGVLIFGGSHNTIKNNEIIGNRGRVEVSGGVFLAPGSIGNTIAKNVIRGSRPADIVDASENSTNVFKNNRCDKSVPGGICSDSDL